MQSCQRDNQTKLSNTAKLILLLQTAQLVSNVKGKKNDFSPTVWPKPCDHKFEKHWSKNIKNSNSFFSVVFAIDGLFFLIMKSKVNLS